MPFCPQCRAEYVEGILQCADCGVSLVDVLPPEPEHAHPRVVSRTVTVFQGLRPISEMIADALLGQGIPSVVQGSGLTAEQFGSDWTYIDVAEEDAREHEAAIRACIEQFEATDEPEAQ